MSSAFLLVALVGVIFGLLGALCAYLITYAEWRHHYPTPEVPRRMAFETAAFTFIFFIGVAILVGIVFR